MGPFAVFPHHWRILKKCTAWDYKRVEVSVSFVNNSFLDDYGNRLWQNVSSDGPSSGSSRFTCIFPAVESVSISNF